MITNLRIAAVLLVTCGCGSPPPQETTPGPSTQAAEPTPSRPTTAPPEAPAIAAAPPGAAPTLSVVGTPASIGQHVAISITNRGATPAELSTRLTIEVEQSGAFAPTDHGTLSLRYDCAQEAPACVTLAPGAELIPPEWLGTWGDVQCVCTRCGPVEAGTYRFVATTCDGAHRVEGTPFTITR